MAYNKTCGYFYGFFFFLLKVNMQLFSAPKACILKVVIVFICALVAPCMTLKQGVTIVKSYWL